MESPNTEKLECMHMPIVNERFALQSILAADDEDDGMIPQPEIPEERDSQGELGLQITVFDNTTAETPKIHPDDIPGLFDAVNGAIASRTGENKPEVIYPTGN